jgi:hypothetical protein
MMRFLGRIAIFALPVAWSRSLRAQARRLSREIALTATER